MLRALEGFLEAALLLGGFYCLNLRFPWREAQGEGKPWRLPFCRRKAKATRGGSSQMRCVAAAPKTAEVVTERYRPGSQLRV